MLIDCGSAASPGSTSRTIDRYTRHIYDTVMANEGDRLDVVVATSRQTNHISGFGERGAGHIAKTKPGLVVQPWTEDPKFEPDISLPPVTGDSDGSKSRRFTHQLASMSSLMKQLTRVEQFASPEGGETRSETDRTAAKPELAATDGEAVDEPTISRLSGATGIAADQVEALCDINITDEGAVQALRTMGSQKPRYLHYGMQSGIEDVIPGIQVDVLGPTSIQQGAEVSHLRHTDDSEFWHLAAHSTFAAGIGSTTAADSIFPKAPTEPRELWVPPVHWLVPKLRKVHGNQILSLTRILDRAQSNTSLILLITVGSRRLLFSGDAQIEAWEYPLFQANDKARVRRQLRWTNVYKVGHHGSQTATPKSLWEMFSRRGPADDPNRLLTLLSTRNGSHGHGSHGTTVPWPTLVDELGRSSSLIDSREYKSADNYFHDIELSTSKNRPLVIDPSDAA